VISRRALLSGALTGLLAPIAAAPQQPAPRRIGFLAAGSAGTTREWIDAFSNRLRELGWIEGRNIAIEFRYADGRPERFEEIAADFVSSKVDVIVTWGTPTVLATKRATSVIPIVFAIAADPVGDGLVASLARPGGNVTGLSTQHADASAKRLELIREIVPSLRRLAIIANVGNPASVAELRDVQKLARALGLDVLVAEVRQAKDIEPAVKPLKGHADALLVAPDALLNNTERNRLATLALEARLPTVYANPDPVTAGGLLSYGPSYVDLFRRAADYADKILRGAKPSDLPVEQPTKLDLRINMKTAKALGLTIPRSLLLRADHVIEQ
jgi:putative ABC transport system substrate-binding protein